jgi:D-beta-D-heptose 7-phosphate kinase/D-beta-D-heptose 1-phosphate adenosyltransferase
MKIKIPPYEDRTILVVGDIMLDKYCRGVTDRISPEAPVPIVQVNSIEERPGGAANVAFNLRSLGCRVILLGIIGSDSTGESLVNCLKKAGIDCRLQFIADLPTITKLRVLGRNQQLIRLDFEETFNKVSKSFLLAEFKAALPSADAVIFSDYGKGTLSAIQEMIQTARRANLPIFVDPKNKDFSNYREASVITPNLKEFEQVVGHCASESDLVSKAQLLIAQTNLKALLITRGEEGLSLVFSDQPALHLRAHASEVYDVSGAGDTVISLLAATYASGCDLRTASEIANIAAGLVVRKLGVATVSVPELRRALQRYHHSDLGILKEEDLIIAVQDAKAHGERIVMTNGCFDLLHVGHITYLEAAKSLGDRLIVAVNDDCSVQRLKGKGRPINKLPERMVLLCALRCVDWVVPFSEDTPESLIAKVLPDILVKGGDYTVREIAGGRHVLENGGTVRTLNFVKGHSSSLIIKRIQEEETCLL